MKISAQESRRAIHAIHLAIQKAQKGQLMEKKFVFIGGGVVPLLITDPAAAPSRPTKDVDVVLSVTTQGEYSYMRQDLMNAGFHDDITIEKPQCALFYGEWRVDFLCASPEVMGNGNRWFSAVMRDAVEEPIEDVFILRAATPTWIATKLEAWFSRGHLKSGAPDYFHQDIEDIVAVLDGRTESVVEIQESPDDVRDFLRQTLGMLATNPDFQSALPGHTGGYERAAIVIKRMQEIIT